MARRSRQPGRGMTPLFDMESVAPPDNRPAKATRGGGRQNAGQGAGQETATPPMPVAYWIRGVFRFGNGEERTHTVDGVGMSTRLADDAARFVGHLREEGWLFAHGRGVLVELLGVAAADDGALLVLAEDRG